MRRTDVAPAADMIRRGDFGEREAFLAWAIERPTIAPLVAEGDGRVVGTGLGSAHGAVGWVGTIFVDPSWRGAGLGRRITRAVIDELEARGCRTQILIASSLGRPIYEREGFAVLDQQVRFSIDGLPPDPPFADPRVRAYRPSDLDAILALDRFATGEDRSAVLRALVEPASTLVTSGPDRDVDGYLARAPFRGGALIATDPEDALCLLEARRHATGISGKAGAGLVGSNEVGRARLRAAGWLEELGGLRMIRGEPLEWHLEAIWGQFNGALG